ncbi:MAG: mobilization protein [Fibrobacteria bacterium]|nr:mobilization protein [Fibrobacteria bacterium]
MGRIHLIGGEKGGVGKSLVARLLVQKFIDRNRPVQAFDTDRSHPSLLRYYGDFSSFVDTGSAESLDRILESACESSDREVVVDLAAQTTPAMARWIEDSQLAEAAGELEVEILWWHVMDAGRDAVELLRAHMDRFGSTMGIVVVLNEVRGERFDLLDESGLKARAAELGARFVKLRRIQDESLRRIDALGASFWAAMNPVEGGPSLGLLERRRVRSWLERSFAEFEQAGI